MSRIWLLLTFAACASKPGAISGDSGVDSSDGGITTDGPLQPVDAGAPPNMHYGPGATDPPPPPATLCTGVLGFPDVPMIPFGDVNNVFVADLDRDGIPDLIRASLSPPSTVFIGRGDGTFVRGADVALGTRTALADVNGDGILDLVGIGTSVPNFGTALGRSDGTFATPVFSATAPTGPLVAAGDLDGDGSADVVLADEYSVIVLLSAGGGTFASPVTYAESGMPQYIAAIAVGDLNADGRADVAIAMVNGEVQIFLSEGGGVLGAPQTVMAGTSIYGLSMTDIDRDGDVDIVVSDDVSVNVLLNAGNGTFPNRIDSVAPGEHGAIAIGNLDGDGHLDIVRPGDPEGLTVLLGNGSGSFTVGATYDAYVSSPVVIADLNRDGKPDVVVGNNASGGGLGLLLNRGDGTFSRDTTALIGGDQLQLAMARDVDGDGIEDLIVESSFASGSPTPTMISIDYGDASSPLSTSVSYATSVDNLSIPQFLVGDIDGDGHPDIVAPARYGQPTTVLLANGDRTFHAIAPAVVPTDPIGVLVDLDGDAKRELVTVSKAGVVTMWRYAGGTFFSYPPTNTPPAAWIAAGDLDGDGNQDVVVAGSDLNSLTVLLGAGDGTWRAQLNSSVTLGGHFVLADIDHDGVLDLVGDDGRAHGNGDGTFSATSTDQVGYMVAARDVDGDGVPDLVAAVGGSIGIAHGHGDGTFPVFASYVGGADGVGTLGDFDADGHPDLALGFFVNGTIAIWPGRCLP